LNIPEDLQYTKSHEWVRIEGDTFDADESFGTVESVKAVSDLYTPVGGEVVEVNSALEDAPENINEDPYGEGWIVKLRTTDEADLLSSEEYEKVVEEES
jgi:glycine cleavage system H protein